MAQFVEFTNATTESKVIVNVDYIISIKPDDDGSVLTIDGFDKALYITESVEQIEDTLLTGRGNVFVNFRPSSYASGDITIL